MANLSMGFCRALTEFVCVGKNILFEDMSTKPERPKENEFYPLETERSL